MRLEGTGSTVLGSTGIVGDWEWGYVQLVRSGIFGRNWEYWKWDYERLGRVMGNWEKWEWCYGGLGGLRGTGRTGRD